LAFVGYGRAGKDTAAEWFRDHTNLRHTGSSSDTCKPLVALMLGQSIERCFAERHRNRLFWKQFLDNFRKGTYTGILDRLGDPFPDEIRNTPIVQAILRDPGLVAARDPAKIIRLHLESADIVPGIRGDVELAQAKSEGLLDLVVWIENERVPRDPTVDFDRGYADICIDNNTTLDVFQARLARLASSLKGVSLKEAY
jgi:hypothetical protein